MQLRDFPQKERCHLTVEPDVLIGLWLHRSQISLRKTLGPSLELHELG